MIVVVFILGSKAEFLNAYSVVQRMMGQEASSGESLVAKKLGTCGEVGVVLATNLAVGGTVTGLIRFFARQ